MKPIYIKAERFFPISEYEEFSRITGRNEIVTFDVCLCPIIVDEGIHYEVYEDEAPDYTLLLKAALKPDEQIIAYFVNPTEDYHFHVLDDGFEFCGYDLSEEMTGISAITNCGGGFDTAISYDQLNKFGLLNDFFQAYEVRDKLENQFPEDDHAFCEVYELWRML
ncbi:MAG: hypothetical protein FWD25_11435 [Clostridia bacterium]|nr:hypothetical protein [Clostridia bacterium]